jgi:hypothetical protein
VKKKKRGESLIQSDYPGHPSPEWQTGEFSQHASFRFVLPYQFLLLCKLMDLTPRQALTDFMENLAHGSWKREGRDTVRERLKEYFIGHGYGIHLYSPDDISTIFEELNAIGMLFPKNADAALLDMHSAWRTKYYTFWFQKWYRRNKTSPEII